MYPYSLSLTLLANTRLLGKKIRIFFKKNSFLSIKEYMNTKRREHRRGSVVSQSSFCCFLWRFYLNSRMPLYADKIFSLELLLRDVVPFPKPDGQALQSVHESSYLQMEWRKFPRLMAVTNWNAMLAGYPNNTFPFSYDLS